MVSGKILQNTLEGINKITGEPVALLDKSGNPVFSAGDLSGLPHSDEIRSLALNQYRKGELGSFAFAPAQIDSENGYLVAVGGKDRKLIADLAVMQLQSLGEAYKEQLDKDTFIKNLLLDNVLLVDVYNRARKFGIPESARRVVILLECPPKEGRLAESAVRAAAGIGENDFLTAVDDRFWIIVRQLEEETGYEEIQEAVKKAVEAAGEGIRAAYGTIVSELKDISRSYKEAQMAIDIGKIFSPESMVLAYSSLGIGRLIYQLPVPLCKMFIKEIFSGRSPEFFDEETIVTINKFFENNLNVSETSRQLYIHRNTLVYRLDKIYKMTGLDLRLFEDAITFKIALMVVRYMNYMKEQEQ